MNHLHMEQILLASNSATKSTIDFYQNKSSIFQYWNNETGQSDMVPLWDVFRRDANKPNQPVNSTVYNSLGLHQAYLIFCLGFFSFGLLLYALKTGINVDFRKADTFSRLQHMMWAINTPETFKDWDLTRGDRQKFISKWWEKYREITAMQSLQLASNLCLLGPLMNTGITVHK